MYYLPFFFLSILSIHAVHGYLLFKQRSNRKWSISVHAVENKQSFRLYILGHVLGGVFFLIFAYRYYYLSQNLKQIFYIAVVAAVFEFIQAFIPAKGKTNALHSATAYIMWVSYILVSLVSYFALPMSDLKKVLAAPLLLVLVVLFIYVHFNLKRLYFYQMWMTTLMSAAMFIMII